jgi:hypothetical protein
MPRKGFLSRGVYLLALQVYYLGSVLLSPNK